MPTRGTRQRGRHRDLTVTVAFLCRVPSWHSGNPLPSARHAALGKEAFAVKGYADSSLPVQYKARVSRSDNVNSYRQCFGTPEEITQINLKLINEL